MKTLSFVVLMSIAAAASAQPYLGAGAEALRYQAQDLHETRTAVQLIAGYRLGPVAIEAFCAGNADCGAGVLGHLALGGRGFSLFGRLAAHHLKGEISSSSASGGAGGPTGALSSGGTITTSSAAWSGWAPAIGGGVQFAPADGGLGARLLLEQTRGVGQLERARVLSISGLFTF